MGSGLVTGVTAAGFATRRNTRVMFSMSPEREERTPRIEPRWLVPGVATPARADRRFVRPEAGRGRAPGPRTARPRGWREAAEKPGRIQNDKASRMRSQDLEEMRVCSLRTQQCAK